MGRNHARVLQDLDSFDLCAVVDPDNTSIRQPVAQFASVESLDLATIDVAIVATPSITHEDIGIFLLERGIHTLIEKPLSGSLDGGMNLIRARDRSGATGMVGHLERFNPAVSALKKLIMSGGLGEIYQFSSRRQGFFPERITDVGVAKDLAVHDIDLCRYLTGREYGTVFASSSHCAGREFEDIIFVSGKLDNGIVFNHVVDWISPRKERSLVVNGEKGMAVADTISGELTIFENGNHGIEREQSFFHGVTRGEVHLVNTSRVEPLMSELSSFASSVQKNEPVACTFEDGLAAMTVVEAALQSAEGSEPLTFRGAVDNAGLHEKATFFER